MPSLSIIIPCYNEEKRLQGEVIQDFLSDKGNISIVFVNDGSTDKTGEVLNHIQSSNPSRINVITHKTRMGKAEAVRSGILESLKITTVTHHGFIDADLSISPSELYRLFEILITNEYKFILGSRIKKVGSKIIRNEWRHFYSRVIATIVGWVIKLDVYDTQCSAKIFEKEMAPSLFAEKFHTKWLFDVELLCRIQNTYGDLNASGTEEPVKEWTEKKGSKLRWYNFFQILKEVFTLRKYYRHTR